MHRLLQRQLRKLGLEQTRPPSDAASWECVLERITQSYAEFDQDRYLLERSLILSSDELQQLSANLTAERDDLRVILSSISDGLCVMDAEGRVRLLNSSAGRQLGWGEADVLGQDFLARIGLDHIEYSSILSGGQLHTDDSAQFVRRDGSTFACAYSLCALGNGSGAVLVFRDVSERQRREAMRVQLIEEQAARALAEAAHLAAQSEIEERARVEAALAYQAAHDALTGLPNRVLLHDKAERAIQSARETSGTAALLLMDLDRFKEINDTLGHQAGDALLRIFGERLAGSVRATDTVARLGGDEFAVLLPHTGPVAAEKLAHELLKALATDMHISEQVVDVGASIGVAAYPEHGDDFSTLLRCADVAMYAAKRAGGGVSRYATEHDANSRERLKLVRELREAITGDQLVVHYQPIIELGTGKVSGVEALVRWQHPRLGLLFPDSFIPIAEQTGQICALTRAVLIQAMTQVQRWRAAGLDLSVSVNLSPRSLQEPDTAEGIARLLRELGVSPSWLTLEITESMLMAEPRRAREVVHSLRSTGIRIAIDDFGTGYSSLAYLKHLPVDVLKIDRSFVKDMASERQDLAIVRSAIELGHNLGLQIVAEGVESLTVQQLLAESGCDFAQGYHFSKPKPADELAPLLELPGSRLLAAA